MLATNRECRDLEVAARANWRGYAQPDLAEW
jgi:hypothetical protein